LVAGVLTLGGALAWSIPALASATKPAKIILYKTNIGKILVCGSGCPTGQAGFTVYAFTADKGTKDVCQNNQACIQTWPPVLTKGKPIAGTGVRQSKLGTTRLKNGKLQVTYAGHPIYTYAGDSQKHQTDFVNIYQFNGYWPALNAAGQELDKHGHVTTK
jgi:predicted lipoprotein with Yx(FWY)xxD motif